MTESIKRDEAIRLNNGRIYTLDAAKIGTNEYEVMLFNPRTGEEIDSAKTSTEADAILQFEKGRGCRQGSGARVLRLEPVGAQILCVLDPEGRRPGVHPHQSRRGYAGVFEAAGL